jgi:hypothetical protein
MLGEGFGFCFRWHPRFVFFAGIRVAPSRRGRRPCAGQHLLFFAAVMRLTDCVLLAGVVGGRAIVDRNDGQMVLLAYRLRLAFRQAAT